MNFDARTKRGQQLHRKKCFFRVANDFFSTGASKNGFVYSVHGKTFNINFYYSIFQFSEKRITLRIFVSKNTKLYNNDMKLQYSS